MQRGELRTGSSHRGERKAGRGDKALGVCPGHLQAGLEATLFHYSFPESCEVFMKTLILQMGGAGVSPQGANDSPKPHSAHPKLGLSASELLGGLSECSCSSACGGDEELPVCGPAPESKPSRHGCVLCGVPSLGARHISLGKC